MAAAVAAREISARELMELHLARIAEVNPAVNAVVSLDEERARAGAAEADERLARGEEVGRCTGCRTRSRTPTRWPAGVRRSARRCAPTTCPTRDELVVERIRAAGAVPIGQTNVPEWAAGSHTFNPIFGTTRNPYDLTRSAGGSSGGAAAALASGMVPLADGSDMGGSLRNPASFCNVVGLRPSVGRVPGWPTANAWEPTSVSGPMARNVDDLAFLLSVIAGPVPRAPTVAGVDPGATFAPPVHGDLPALRVALSRRPRRMSEVDTDVARVVDRPAARCSRPPAPRRGRAPGAAEADAAFRTLRAWLFHARFRDAAGDAPRRVQAVAGGQHPGSART